MRFRLSERNDIPQEDLFSEKQVSHSKLKESSGIKVLGVGGAGCKAINLMMKGGQHFPFMSEVKFIGINTDKQDLASIRSGHKIQIGIKLTNGLGSGGKPEVGRAAIEENYDDVKQVLNLGSVQQEGQGEPRVIFVVCGMGGGTGTGASPVIAEIGKIEGDFVVGVVTSPFYFEGEVRVEQAKEGIHKLRRQADALINISNERLFNSSELMNGEPGGIGKEDPFTRANKLLVQVVYELIDIILHPGLVNIDFADVCSVISEAGETGIGIGSASGEERALKAVKQAISSPMLTGRDINRARGILINIVSGSKVGFKELQEIFFTVRDFMSVDTHMIFGIRVEDKMGDELKVTIIAGGIMDNRKLNDKENLKTPTLKRKLLESGLNSKFGYEGFTFPGYMRRKGDGLNKFT